MFPQSMEKSLGFSATKLPKPLVIPLPRPPGAAGVAAGVAAGNAVSGGPGEVRRSVGSVGSVEAVG